jgi:hypothetical protein
MVNDTFKDPRTYGFESVHAQPPCKTTPAFINEKFTPNRLMRIFGEFSSI